MRNWKKISPIALISYAVLLFFALYYIEYVWHGVLALLHILMPFIVGACIAFILHIPMNSIEKGIHRIAKRNERMKWIRPISIALTLAIFFGIVVAILFLVIPEFAATFQNIAEAMPGFWIRVQERVQDLPFDWENLKMNIIGSIPDFEEISSYLIDFAQNSLGGMLSSFAGVVFSVGQTVMNLVIGLIFAIYILVSKEKLANQMSMVLKAFLPVEKAKRIKEISSMTNRIFSNFFTGQCIEAVILGGLFFVTMSILRLPYALLVSCVIAVFALIPIVGAFVGCFIGAFLILIVDPVQALIFVIMFLILQQIEGNLIYPHVVGSSVGLPSIWVLMAVTVGGSLFGIVGMLVFIPLISVAYCLFRETVVKKLKLRRNKQT